MGLWIGFQAPTCVAIFSVYLGYAVQDLLFDLGSPWKNAMTYHTDQHKVMYYDSQLSCPEVISVVFGILITIVAFIHRSLDELGLVTIIGAVAFLRRYRVNPIIEHLSKDATYVGWEKYAQEYLQNLKLYDAVTAGILGLTVVSQLEAMRITSIRKTTTMYRGPWAVVVMGVAAGLVCKNLVVDATYPSWRRQTIYYRDVQGLTSPFHLYDKALCTVAAVLVLLSVLSSKKILHVASLVLVVGAAGVAAVPYASSAQALAVLKQTTSKSLREGRANALLADIHVWNLIALGLLVAAMVTHVIADRFEREPTPEEIQTAAAEDAAAKQKAKAKADKERYAAMDKLNDASASSAKTSASRKGVIQSTIIQGSCVEVHCHEWLNVVSHCQRTCRRHAGLVSAIRCFQLTRVIILTFGVVPLHYWIRLTIQPRR
eukprot:m.662526 g.662526  ORF g.662526 m.662526 type:complete len:430 (-) comp22741_c0_seq13:3162-4451(-)